MKSLLFSIAILSMFPLYSQEKTGVYKISWQIDKRLTNSFSVTNNGNDFGNGRINIPQNLMDSVVNEVLLIATQELKCDAHLLYPLSNKGTELMYRNTSEQVGSLPRGTRKKALRTEYLDYYMKVKIRVDVSKGPSIGNEVANYSRLHPYVRVKMKAYGADRRKKYRKSSYLGNFKSIGSFEYNLGGVTVTNTNAIPIQEIVTMTLQGLDKFKNKVR